MRPPQVWGAASAPPTGVRAASDDWLPGVGACNLIGREAELGACPGDEPSPPTPGKSTLGAWVLGQDPLTEREERKNRGHRAENSFQVYQGSPVTVSSPQG